ASPSAHPERSPARQRRAESKGALRLRARRARPSLRVSGSDDMLRLVRRAALCAVLALPLAAGRAVADGAVAGLARVPANGELRWGADAQGGARYVFQDPMEPNHLIGFEVDLADALAARLGVRARPIQGPWDRLLELVGRGDFDVALNGIEVAEEKKRVC